MQKNVAGQKIGAQMVSATDGSAFTGSVTVAVTGDAGTQATGSVGSGACTHEGNGYHTYAPAQAETNYDLIAFTFTGTGAVPVTVQVYTRHDANTIAVSGTAQTARDLGASVLLSSGTGTGQVSLSGGKVAANVVQIEGADASDIFDGLSSDIAGVDSAIAALNDLSATDVWSHATRLLTAGTNIVLAKGTGITGFNDLDAAGIRSAVGLGSANLDTQLAALPTAAENADAVWDEASSGHATGGTFGKAVADILADTNELQADWANGGRLDLLIDDIIADIATVDSALTAVDSNVDAILLDTGTDGVVVASLGSSALDSIHDEPITEPSARPAWSSMTHRKLMQVLGVMMLNESNSDDDSVTFRNDADSADLWAFSAADDGTTYTSGKAA